MYIYYYMLLYYILYNIFSVCMCIYTYIHIYIHMHVYTYSGLLLFFLSQARDYMKYSMGMKYMFF